MNTIRKLLSIDVWGHILFWTWNLIFSAFTLLGFVPILLVGLFDAVAVGDVPMQFFVFGLVITCIPIAALIIGLKLWRTQPRKLLAFGYGIEGPLMILMLIRFFAIRQLTWATGFLLFVALLGMATLAWQLIDERINLRPAWQTFFRIFGLSALLLTGAYASMLIAFYMVPLANMIGQGIIELSSSYIRNEGAAFIFFVPFMLLSFGPYIFLATVVVFMPIAIPIIYSTSWWQGMKNSTTRFGFVPTALLSVAVMTLAFLLFQRTTIQPQQAAFALLEDVPDSREDALMLDEQTEIIRAGLLNSYLAPTRYLSAAGEVYHIADLYADDFGMGWEQERADAMQARYERIARPLLYQPIEPAKKLATDSRWNRDQAMRREPAVAADKYQEFFDEPIVEGEKEAVVRAARSTFDGAQARANWQLVDDREIYLREQSITVNEHGDWAAVELHEVYENVTFERQEVVYYVSLPESAVITSVWLGDDDGKQFAHRVAPRGAAQQVYQEQVQRNTDPALVEQVGPSQYRIRVFPVEPARRDWSNNSGRSTLIDAPALHLWLTYNVLGDNGAWPLPQLSEKRNVYWDNNSIRLINDEQMMADEDTWLPENVASETSIVPTAHRVDFGNGESIVAQPATETAQSAANQNLAVVLDRSRSMIAQADAVTATFAELASSDQANIDVYLTASEFYGEAPKKVALADVDAANILYFGGQNPSQLLAQFAELAGDESYDAVIVLTDGSGYELGESEHDLPAFSAPIWMAHLGDKMPLGYDDETLEAVQASGGGAVNGLSQALVRISAVSQTTDTLTDLIDGYTWTTAPTASVSDIPVDDAFAPLAARRFTLSEMYRNRANLDQLDSLDLLHEIAVEQSIVTPYSSMIVLINSAQERRLDELENKADRFDREHEDVGETIQPNALTGVPEPEEWLLIGLSVLMLGWYLKQKREDGLRVA